MILVGQYDSPFVRRVAKNKRGRIRQNRREGGKIMPTAVDIWKALTGLPVLRNRRPDTPEQQAASAYATLAETRNSGVFARSFQGEGAWERHRHGDELVQIFDGETRLTILTESGRTELNMKAGMVTVVPQGCWHKFNAPTGVTVQTMTPQPTDHFTDEDPRRDGDAS